MLAYRRDIFAKHNLKPPETYEEFGKLLRVLKDKEGIGALASRGQAGHQEVHAWLLHLNPMGGSICDEQWKTRFNDKAGIDALKFCKRWWPPARQALPATATVKATPPSCKARRRCTWTAPRLPGW